MFSCHSLLGNNDHIACYHADASNFYLCNEQPNRWKRWFLNRGENETLSIGYIHQVEKNAHVKAN